MVRLPGLRACLAFAAAGLILAGCAGRDPAPGGHGVPGLETGGRVIGREAAYVEAYAAHRSRGDRIDRVTLVTPEGKEIAPDEIRRDEIPARSYRPYAGSVFVGGGSGGITHAGVGVGISFPLVFGRRRYSRSVHRTIATFEVPDPAAYRADPGAWRIRYHLVDRESGPFVIERAAPRPTR